MDFSRTSNTIGFIDLLFNTLLGFAYLFVLAFLMMNPPDPAKIDPKVEAIMVMSWPIEAEHDFDMWLKLPNGTHVGYQIQNNQLGHLDRDDRGNADDTIELPNGDIITHPINREVISLRGLEPGTYILNVHFYGAFTTVIVNEYDGQGHPGTGNDRGFPTVYPRSMFGSFPTTITVEFIDLQPRYDQLYTTTFVLAIVQSERTALQFTVTPEGDIVNINEQQFPFIIRELFAIDGRNH